MTVGFERDETVNHAADGSDHVQLIVLAQSVADKAGSSDSHDFDASIFQLFVALVDWQHHGFIKPRMLNSILPVALRHGEHRRFPLTSATAQTRVLSIFRSASI